MDIKEGQQIISPQNIIVRMPNWLGDFIMATPVLTDLRHHWPEAKLTAMCQGTMGEILEKDPHLDEILNFRRPSGWIHRREHGDIIEPLRLGHYDLGILLTNSFSSAWWFWRGHVQNRIGYAKQGRSWLLTQAVPLPLNYRRQHLVITYKMLLESLGIPLSATLPRLYVADKEELVIQEWLAKYAVNPHVHKIIGINPGAAYGSAKCWPPDRFKKLTERLIEDPKCVVLFFGDKTGAALINEICLGLPERVINLAGKTTLRELMAFIKTCHVFLTNDSGPMHMASTLGTPLVALFGSTNPQITGPYQGGTVIYKQVKCSPCYLRKCPIDFRCMRQIEVNEVYEELKKLLI